MTYCRTAGGGYGNPLERRFRIQEIWGVAREHNLGMLQEKVEMVEKPWTLCSSTEAESLEVLS